jgi:magnesium-protoporphyrin O-methyltransferase
MMASSAPSPFVPSEVEAPSREGPSTALGTKGSSYNRKRETLETYFDRTARDAWERLTSDAQVSGIRATVRAGRDKMRGTILDMLPADMTGLRLLDAGCGTGSLAVEAAMRGAHVVAIDVAAGLVDIARKRAPTGLKIDWRSGDMLSADLGSFDHVVAMDSLIHYRAFDIVDVITELASRTRGSILFTFAPKTPLLTAMHTAGLLFPRSDRAPAIIPVTEKLLRKLLTDAIPAMTVGRSTRVSGGFYTSQVLEVA